MFQKSGLDVQDAEEEEEKKGGDLPQSVKSRVILFFY